MGSKLGGSNQERVKRETAVRDRIFQKEKNVLDRNMDVSLRAMDREYAELLKKQTELVTVKSGIHYLKDTDDAQRRAMRGASSRSNLAAASNRQLQQLYVQEQSGAKQVTSGHSLLTTKNSRAKLSSHNLQTSNLPSTKGAKVDRATQVIKKKGAEGSSTPKQVHMESSKPGTSGVAKLKQDKKPLARVATADTANKAGKGKGKTTVPQNGAVKPSDTHVKPTRERGSHENMHTDHSRRKSSVDGSKKRRESITGQTFNRDEMEEQQKILNLFIHLVEKVEDPVFDPADTTKVKGGPRAGVHDKTGSPGSHHQTMTPNGRKGSLLHDDTRLMKDLQGILERRKSIDPHGTPAEIADGLEAAQTPHGRGGKRRMSGMEMITDIIGVYKSQYVKDVNFDPLAMLNCGYLRLSDSNVKELERLCREQGIDPGIHAHSNVDDYILFP